MALLHRLYRTISGATGSVLPRLDRTTGASGSPVCSALPWSLVLVDVPFYFDSAVSQAATAPWGFRFPMLVRSAGSCTFATNMQAACISVATIVRAIFRLWTPCLPRRDCAAGAFKPPSCNIQAAGCSLTNQLHCNIVVESSSVPAAVKGLLVDAAASIVFSTGPQVPHAGAFCLQLHLASACRPHVFSLVPKGVSNLSGC